MSISRRRFTARSTQWGLAGVFSHLAGAELSLANVPLKAPTASPLALPAGFTATIIDRKRTEMDDGYRVPGKFDGMGCLPGSAAGLSDDYVVLMRNHELMPVDLRDSPYRFGQRPPSEAYSRTSLGGVTRVIVNQTTLAVEHRNLVLAGTMRNCAGGLSPWGWLSCEEATLGSHGWVFACDPSADRVQSPRRIQAYGRFQHEAATVDPTTMIAYLTEDREDSCFYRFVPHSPDSPWEGQLQALALVDQPKADTGTLQGPDGAQAVRWINLGHTDAPNDDLRTRAQAEGAAIIHRGEGLWLDGEQVYFTATSGGPHATGQLFRLTTDHGRDQNAGHVLEAVVDGQRGDQFNMPDNITVAPWGDLVIAEDNLDGEQHLHLLHRESGRLIPFAKNIVSGSELAGVCFTPDGSTLFVNIYSDGLTVAIQGPFEDFIDQNA